jgi:hypothetical protein
MNVTPLRAALSTIVLLIALSSLPYRAFAGARPPSNVFANLGIEGSGLTKAWRDSVISNASGPASSAPSNVFANLGIEGGGLRVTVGP